MQKKITLGATIRALRKKNNMSIKQLARKASLCENTIIMLENDMRLPRVSTMISLKKALKEDIFDVNREMNLVEENEERNKQDERVEKILSIMNNNILTEEQKDIILEVIDALSSGYILLNNKLKGE